MAYLTGQALTQADLAALFTSGTYTPTLGNMVIGTGGTPTNSAKFTFAGFPAGGILTVEGKIKFGTTTPTVPGAAQETISLPAGYSMITTDASALLSATVSYVDVSAGSLFDGSCGPASATTLNLFVKSVSGTVILTNTALSATVPMAWAINDEIYYRIVARCTGP